MVDNADNLTTDPSTGLTYTWNARNQLTAFSGGITETYDSLGRRETSVNGQTLSLLDDGQALTAWLSPTAGMWSFLNPPGGSAIAGTFNLSGSNTYVPLTDIAGSTIALVNVSQQGSPITTTYAYDPTGMPTVSGAANSWPLLWHGLEHEVTDPAHLYFEPSGNVYNPDPVHLSLLGPQGLSAGSNGSSNQIDGAPSGSSGFSKAESFGIADGASIGAFWASVGALWTGDGLTLGQMTVPAIIATIVDALVQIFLDLFDSGSDAPPIPYQLKHQRHMVYSNVLGISTDLIVNQKPLVTPNSGNVTYYNLVGKKTASGEPFNPTSYSGAIFQKPGIHLGDCANVKLQSDASRAVNVRINDHGPFERDEKGKPLRPLRADPEVVIDLTPSAFTALNGSLTPGKVAVIVTPGGTCQ